VAHQVFRRICAVLKTDAAVEDIAERFVAARRAARALSDYPGRLPQDLATAYAIQDAAIAAFDGAICGWKVGRINAPLSDTLGTTRLFGPCWTADLQSITPGAVPVARIFEGGFGAAEAEFMFRIGRAPAVGTSALTLAAAADLIDAVFVGFEIASSPFSGVNALGPLVTISDFGNNGGLIVGPEISDWRSSGLEKWIVETWADGKLVGSGRASSFPDGPLGSVKLLVENLLQRGHPVTPGLLISTGAVSGVHEVTAGQRVRSRFGEFVEIECVTEFART
jgi:2-keto-4-pentenoate hydratase